MDEFLDEFRTESMANIDGVGTEQTPPADVLE